MQNCGFEFDRIFCPQDLLPREGHVCLTPTILCFLLMLLVLTYYSKMNLKTGFLDEPLKVTS